MDFSSFVELVKDMRQAQKGYFSQRTPDNLANAKKLESKVDKAVDNYYNPTIF